MGARIAIATGVGAFVGTLLGSKRGKTEVEESPFYADQSDCLSEISHYIDNLHKTPSSSNENEKHTGLIFLSPQAEEYYKNYKYENRRRFKYGFSPNPYRREENE